MVKYFIFGGTGSLGRALVARCLGHSPIVVFSRDEAKHYRMQQEYGDRIICNIGDVRDYRSVVEALSKYRPDCIINAAALKQVPLCEQFPSEAAATNIQGTINICQAVRELFSGVRDYKTRCVSVSTDKAVSPINAYGATKMLQEKIHLTNNGHTAFNCVRYGNVLESTGSVIPLFRQRLQDGKRLPITDVAMTRFLLSLDDAVDLIFKALEDYNGGNIYVPRLRSASVFELAGVLAQAHGVPFEYDVIGIRPGEKLHEILITDDECHRTDEQPDCFVIRKHAAMWQHNDWTSNNFSSAWNLITGDVLKAFLSDKGAIK